MSFLNVYQVKYISLVLVQKLRPLLQSVTAVNCTESPFIGYHICIKKILQKAQHTTNMAERSAW